MSDHIDSDRLRRKLLDMSGMSSNGADPMPTIERRVRRHRRRRAAFATAGVTGVAAIATAGALLLSPSLGPGGEPSGGGVLQFANGMTGEEPADRGPNQGKAASKDPEPDKTGEDKTTPKGKCAIPDEEIAEHSDLVVEGACFEEYVEGERGTGYFLGSYDSKNAAVSYRKDGDGEPCVALEYQERQEDTSFCFTGFEPGEEVAWKYVRGADGEMTGGVIGFVKPGHYAVGLRDEGDHSNVPPTSTPTSDEVAFFYHPRSSDAPFEIDLDNK